ncbi:MAG: hypothetical protein MJZ76_08040, partial [Bacteroidales bacterium]|nr:hypothetical protein [Bacteroidales bacterium]
MMNTFEQSSEFLEQLSQIIDILTIIRDNGDVSSPLDRDVALEQIRFAYAALLKAGQSGNAEVERQAREEQLRKEKEERERAAREEQLRKEQEERERAA